MWEEHNPLSALCPAAPRMASPSRGANTTIRKRIVRFAVPCFSAILLLTLTTLSLPTSRSGVGRLLLSSSACGPPPSALHYQPRGRDDNGTLFTRFAVEDRWGDALHAELRCQWVSASLSTPSSGALRAGAVALEDQGSSGDRTLLPRQCCCAYVGDEQRPRCLPHAVVVGAQKAGTTALFGQLLLRPDFLPPRLKELPHFGKRHQPHILQYLRHLRPYEPGKVRRQRRVCMRLRPRLHPLEGLNS